MKSKITESSNESVSEIDEFATNLMKTYICDYPSYSAFKMPPALSLSDAIDD